jgi:hypothetical protein
MARYKFTADGRMLKLDEATGEWKPERRTSKGKSKLKFGRGVNYVPDIAEFVAHATDTPTLISSRSQLARYERANNIRQVGNDLKGRIVAEGKRRAAAERALVARETRRVRVDTRWV